MGPHLRARRYAPGDYIIYSFLSYLSFHLNFYMSFMKNFLLYLCFLFNFVYQLHFRTCEGYIYFGRRGAIGDPVLGGSPGGGRSGGGGGGRGGGERRERKRGHGGGGGGGGRARGVLRNVFFGVILTIRPFVHGSKIPKTPKTPSDRKSTRLNSSHSQISHSRSPLKKKQT